MSDVQQSAVYDCTSQAEEEALDRIYPWKCYTKDLKSFQEFRTLEEMCQSVKVDVEAVKDAVRFRGGNMGSYHFVQR